MVLPALVLLLALFAGAATVGMTQLRAYDAARAAAREAARGEPQHTVVAEAEKRAGAGSKATIRTEGGYTEVAVRQHREIITLLRERRHDEAIAALQDHILDMKTRIIADMAEQDEEMTV